MSTFARLRTMLATIPNRIRARKGASMLEAGLLLGLIAVVAIGSVIATGDRVRVIYCITAQAMGAKIVCEDLDGNIIGKDGPGSGSGPGDSDPGSGGPGGVPGGGDGSPEEDEETPGEGNEDGAIGPIEPRFLDDVIEVGETGDTTGIGIGGIGNGVEYDFTLTDGDGNVIEAGSGIRAGAENLHENIDLSGAAPGELTLEVVAHLPDGSTITERMTVATLWMGEFPDLFDQEVATAVTSGVAIVAGLPEPVVATATGGATILVNGAPAGGAATVADGDAVQLQVTTPADYEADATVRLQLARFERSWTVATRPFSVDIADFSFRDVTGAEPGAEVRSGTVAITGFDGTLPVAVSGEGAEVSINGGAWTTAGTMVSGDRIALRTVASEQSLGLRTAMVTVGPEMRSWNVQTSDLTTVPQAFAFAPRTDVDPEAFATQAAWIRGFSGVLPVRVTGEGDPQIKVGPNGEWVSSAFIRPGQYLGVRLVSDPVFEGTRSAYVTVGGGGAPFEVTTRAMRHAPNQFQFKARSRVQLSEEVESTGIVIRGNDVPVIMTVSGDAGAPKIRVNEGSWEDSVTVAAGDVVQLRMQSGPGFEERRVATVAAGDVSAEWSVTTRNGATYPNLSQLPPVTDLEPGVLATSESFTIPGIEVPVAITFLTAAPDAEVSVNGGPWLPTATAGPSDSVRLRALASDNYAETRSLAVRIGGRTLYWWTRTTAGNTALPDIRLAPETNLVPESYVWSDAFVVTGLDSRSRVSITGATGRVAKRMANGAFPASPGAYVDVENGDVIKFRALAPKTTGTTVVATVTLGTNGPTTDWSLSTVDGSATPDEFSFPPVENAHALTYYTSEPVIVSGLPEGIPAPARATRVIGASNLVVNGANVASNVTAWVFNGDQVAGQLQSGLATALGQSSVMTISIGERSADFIVTRDDGMIRPDPVPQSLDLSLLPGQVHRFHEVYGGYDGLLPIEVTDWTNMYLKPTVTASGVNGTPAMVPAGKKVDYTVYAPTGNDEIGSAIFRVGSESFTITVRTPPYKLPDPIMMPDIVSQPNQEKIEIPLSGATGDYWARAYRSLDGGALSGHTIYNGNSGGGAARRFGPGDTPSVYVEAPPSGSTYTYVIQVSNTNNFATAPLKYSISFDVIEP